MALDDATLPNVIADVGATLRQLLRDQVADLAPEGRVVLVSPAEVEVTTDPRVGLFLYQVQASAHLRNASPERINGSEIRPFQPLDLFYLITPYTQQVEDSHRLLGQIMRVFGAFGNLQGSILQGSLADIGQALRLVLHPLNMEDIDRLWGIFPNKPYRLSVAYQVTPVKLFAGLTTMVTGVGTTELNYAQRNQ